MNITKNGKISFQLDVSCENCKEGIETMRRMSVRNKDFYANRNQKTGEVLKGMNITPDFNASGIVTHYHISS